MRYITRTSKFIFDSLLEHEREVCSTEIIEHIILLFIECKENYERNLFEIHHHPELYFEHEDEGIDINEYISFIEIELIKDNILINKDLLIKIIYTTREYHKLYTL